MRELFPFHLIGEQFRFPLPLGGEGVVLVVWIAVTDKQKAHTDASEGIFFRQFFKGGQRALDHLV